MIFNMNFFAEPDDFMRRDEDPQKITPDEFDTGFLDTDVPTTHWTDSEDSECEPIETSFTKGFQDVEIGQERMTYKEKVRSSSQLSKKVCRKIQEHTNASFSKLVLTTIRKRYPHADNKYLECDICDLRFRYRFDIQRHMRRWHMAKVKGPKIPYKACCDVCGKPMADRFKLAVHMRIHTGELPYSCSFENCSRAFMTSTLLKYHLARHSNERPFKCDECSACFRVKNTLRSHKHHVHNTVRPYECGQCGLSFKDRYNYKQHVSVHSGERPFNCELCGRSFRQRGVLQVHMNVHTDTRPYKCRECDRDFHSPAARRSHEKIVHKIK